MRTLKAPPMYHACSGIWRGISLVRTGGSLSVALKPKKAPTKTSGTEMPNHMSSSTIIVVKGIGARRALAPDEEVEHEEDEGDHAWVEERREQGRPSSTRSPGATCTCARRSSPRARPSAQRAAASRSAARRGWRARGSRASRTGCEMEAHQSSCMPVPSEAQSRSALGGGRKTSACTSFQPLSS